MSSSSEEEGSSSTLVAIDIDKNSKHAVKWAVDHLLEKSSSCTLIHVKTKSCNRNEFESVPKQGRAPTEEELHQLFLPFRGFCARKGIVAKELVLQDSDVSSALYDYIIDHSIVDVVLGAPRWNNALIRKFKDVDVPTSLIKSLPVSCTVHIISKGKVQNVQATVPIHTMTISSPKPSYLSKDLHRTSFEPRLGRRLSNDGGTFGQNMDARLGSRCLSQRDTYSSKMSISDENQDNGTERETNRLKQDQKYTKKGRSASVGRAVGSSKQKVITDIKQEGVGENEERIGTSNENVDNSYMFKTYSIEEIEIGTNYFDPDGKIGEGGYGPVFKGVLDNTDVAVKALRPDITQGEKQFHQEVLVLGSIRHPNIVVLLGACPEFGCLVYEYLENGSLEDRLYQKDNTPPIPWRTRFKIAAEIATGLLFLHQTKPEPVVHRDLKPANILLDRNYISKITDVGLARLVPPSIANKTTQYHKTAAAGTFCYIDPEYQQTGLLGVKSDIYSLGVMFLQIITGKPPIGVARLVEEAIENDNLAAVLDPNVADWPVEEALSFAKMALKCCEMRKRDRPALATVILPELIRLRDL
ncbi:U-box domain-containing protein 34-like [Vicia villosa]|uniref:U-box domain-containing protein 34-like n=1 Tax=Vicia villosa TaxID=3911 RepID=UPI00273BE03D|nr:U-box domain-containing protein 34-like [Vicia villosa]